MGSHVLVFSLSPESPSPSIPNEADTPDAAAEGWMFLTQRPTATRPIPIPNAAHTFDRIEAIFI